MILCIGSKSSGKTLLLKRLQTGCSLQTNNYLDVANTVPTVGTNIVNVRNNANVCTIVEVGGAMSELWTNYLDDSNNDLDAILYVIDCSNVSKVSQSAITFIQLFSNINLESLKPLMIVLNKTDVNCIYSVNEMRYMLMIDSLIDSIKTRNHNNTRNIEIVETSCVTGSGLRTVFNWIQSFHK